MFVASCQVTCYLPGVTSLKEKRAVVKSLIHRTHNRYPVTIAEVDDQDHHQRAGIGLAVVANERRHAERVVDQAIRYIEQNFPLEITNVERS